MTLLKLIEKLQTLAAIYPEDTTVTVRLADNKAPLDMVLVESDEASVEIVVKGN